MQASRLFDLRPGGGLPAPLAPRGLVGAEGSGETETSHSDPAVKHCLTIPPILLYLQKRS